MRYILVACLILFSSLLEVSGQSRSKSQDPVAYYNMETKGGFSQSQLHHYTSLVVDGISGKARYFKPQTGAGSFSIAEENNILAELWSDFDFSVELWVQTKAENKEFQVIAANKDWNSGEIKDYTDNRYAGLSRTSGINKGWALICQPDGSWAWNIGNGELRKDYRPTAPRQRINDGEWHQIAFSVNREINEARLYFDGRNVAIYYMGKVLDLNSELPVCLANDPRSDNLMPLFDGAIDELSIYDFVLSDNEIAEKYIKYVPAAKMPESRSGKVEELNLMTWNIWHGGRRRGKEIGPQQVIDFIKDTGTDIVMMQETYGSGPLIADALGYYFYLASANLSVISKYPIENTRIAYHELWSGITTIRLSESQKINLASIWLHYLPGWSSDARKPDATPEKLIEGEEENRHKEIKVILAALENEIRNADKVPLIIGGDFNSPSHTEWTRETAHWHNGLIVEWPVSREMMGAGFTDSFRELKSRPEYSSPTISAERLSWCIDYIYYKGKNLKAVDSEMHFRYKGVWPSDHPAVTTTFTWNSK